jgi:GH15 family glucan-1,4-alpha-glucosidase
MKFDLAPRFDYGSKVPLIPEECTEGTIIKAGADQFVLYTTQQMELGEHDVRARFLLREGEERWFQLGWTPSHQDAARAQNPETALEETESFWLDWAEKSQPQERSEHDAVIMRSLLTLKALTYAPTGSIVAAPTTSLPEVIGGERNWDYRYCWPRDAALAMRAVLNSTGEQEEMEHWRRWILRACSGVPEQMEVLYTLEGHRPPPEFKVDWLQGHESSGPVRTGNEASNQFQLDIFGNVIEVLTLALRRGLPPNKESWKLCHKILCYLEEKWEEPDEGIWEVRGPKRQFVHSKVMVWTAFECCIRASRDFGLEGPVGHWEELRDRVKNAVLEKGFNTRKDSFVQYYGGEELDASLLLIPIVGLLPADDPRVVGTVRAIEKELVLEAGIVMRYLPNPEVEGMKAAGRRGFLLCSAWLGEVYMLQGRKEDAERIYRKLVGLTNDVGLLAEQYDPRTKRLLGNFPQAFSHIALIILERAIYRPDKRLRPVP